jgi:Zn-dependent M16 (insulinase) family peptidase
VDKLKDKTFDSVNYTFDSCIKNEGIFNSSNVQFVARGYNYKELGHSYSGYLQVLKNILSLDFLWNKIRVQGGAYGAFSRFEMSGNAYFVSYRDPNLKSTLDTYEEVYKYIENFDISDREMTKYIIGAISNLDQPLTPSQISQRADEMYFRNITAENMHKYKIRALSPLVKEIMKNSYLCVVGNEAVIKENAEYFNRIYNIFDNN